MYLDIKQEKNLKPKTFFIKRGCKQSFSRTTMTVAEDLITGGKQLVSSFDEEIKDRKARHGLECQESGRLSIANASPNRGI